MGFAANEVCVSRKLRLAYVLHSLRSDWNNGNAHFLRGLLREMTRLGHDVIALEEPAGWSETNLLLEERGAASLASFENTFPELHVAERPGGGAAELELALEGIDIVIVHEWNTPEVIAEILAVRDRLGFKALFHDTHHRASSSPAQIAQMQVERFDGVIAFGGSLRDIYRDRFGVAQVAVLHEAADTSIFFPRNAEPQQDVCWIGNWGDDERAAEIREFLLAPASRMPERRFAIWGVRYPSDALEALRTAGVTYRGYLPNLDAPSVYAASRLTVHIPRQQYAAAMRGIPTIRVFEALASGIPLLSAPWDDTEELFRPDDLRFVQTGKAMEDSMRELLQEPARAEAQAARGLATVLARHTCSHRAAELTDICEEVLG